MRAQTLLVGFLTLFVFQTQFALADEHAPIYTVDQLKSSSQGDLNEIYKAGKADKMPEGTPKGDVIVMPDVLMSKLRSKVLKRALWKDKIFLLDGFDEETTGEVYDKGRLGKLSNAKVYLGASFYDGSNSVVMDYSGSKLNRHVRHEMREVSPGVWLGRTYYKFFILNVKMINYFTLDFNR